VRAQNRHTLVGWRQPSDAPVVPGRAETAPADLPSPGDRFDSRGALANEPWLNGPGAFPADRPPLFELEAPALAELPVPASQRSLSLSAAALAQARHGLEPFAPPPVQVAAALFAEMPFTGLQDVHAPVELDASGRSLPVEHAPVELAATPRPPRERSQAREPLAELPVETRELEQRTPHKPKRKAKAIRLADGSSYDREKRVLTAPKRKSKKHEEKKEPTLWYDPKRDALVRRSTRAPSSEPRLYLEIKRSKTK
jgi:hypothetical protein